MVDCVLIRKHSLRHALTHNHNRFAGTAVGVVEIAAGDQGNTESREKPRRNYAEARTGIFFAAGAHVAICGELKAKIEIGIPPGNVGADRYALYAW
jgi:hypothetical protein